MEHFAADWLALREPADHTARSAPLTRALARALPRGTPFHVLDLAAGTGSNMRYVAPRLPEEQRWLLVDHDPVLLAQAKPPSGEGLCRVDTRRVDLAALTDVEEGEIFDGRQLVTASALLDLVSEDWLNGLAARCYTRGSAVLFALSYDGRIKCSPEEPEDATIRELVNRHQRTDKGFGPALGPDATATAERCLAGLGYHVQRAPSDWVLPPESRDLQRSLIGGWAQAAEEIAPEQSATIRDWLARRLAHVTEHRSRLVVGHEDLAAWVA